MAYLLLIFAIIVLFFAHCFKIYRWRQFIEIYEKPDEKVLLRSLSIGYIINFLVFFRIGDIFRAIYSGRKMKNGVSFSLATIIIDRYLDILAVAVLYILFIMFGVSSKIALDSIIFYIAIGAVLALIAAIIIKYNKFIKVSIKKVAKIFNENIELKILKLSWFAITSFKDIFEKINKFKLLINTIIMWSLYLISYTLLAYSLTKMGLGVGLFDIFTMFFAKSNLDVSFINVTTYFNNKLLIISSIYMISPLLLMIIFSLLPFSSIKFKNKKGVIDNKYLELLPQINHDDRLKFLESYFSGESRSYFKNYLKINSDIAILQDFSAGSNATTMLCIKDDKTFFRKYSFGKDSEKLYDQIKWIEDHKKVIPLTGIIEQKRGDGYCSYDMPYLTEAVGCFNFIHSTPINKSWKVLEMVLNDLDCNLHKCNLKNADKSTIEQYINSKVVSNISKIEKGKEIKNLLKYDELIINGKKYKNLNQFDKYLSFDYLYDLFKDDEYSDIHGDLTIENIICLTSYENGSKPYYIIDPNTGNLHDSPALDYGKLLQSLHGGYEFLMNTKSVNVYQNSINYLFTKSVIYDKLFKKYKDYLEKTFSRQKVRSIFFHEVIHWLRLMPYKIEKDEKRSILFYAGLVIVLNEVVEMYGE